MTCHSEEPDISLALLQRASLSNSSRLTPWWRGSPGKGAQSQQGGSGGGAQKLGVKLSVEVCFAFNIPSLLLSNSLQRVSLHAHVEIDLPQPSRWGFPRGSGGKESTCNAGDLGSTPGLARCGEGNGYLLQYSGHENSVDCTVHGVTKNRTRLSDFHFRFQPSHWGFPDGSSCRESPRQCRRHRTRRFAPWVRKIP